MIRFMLVHLILSDLATRRVPSKKSEADHLAQGSKPPYLAWTHMAHERRTWNEFIFAQMICKLWHLFVLCRTTHAASENLSSSAYIVIFSREFSKEILPNTDEGKWV